MYEASGFKLNEKEAKLYYNGKVFLSGCDNITALLMNLGIGETSQIEKFDLDEEEIQYLEQMLSNAILTNGVCINQIEK